MSHMKQLIHIKAPNSSTQKERDAAAEAVARMFPGAGVVCLLEGWGVELLDVRTEDVDPEYVVVRTYGIDVDARGFSPRGAEVTHDPNVHVSEYVEPPPRRKIHVGIHTTEKQVREMVHNAIDDAAERLGGIPS